MEAYPYVSSPSWEVEIGALSARLQTTSPDAENAFEGGGMEDYQSNKSRGE